MISEIFETLSVSFERLVESNFTALANELGGVFYGLIVLWAVFIGYQFFYGGFETTGRKLIAGLIKIFIIVGIVYNWNNYNNLIAQPLQKIPAELAARMLGSDDPKGALDAIFQSIDKFLSTGVGAASDLLSITSVGTSLVAVVAMIGIILTSIAVFVTLLIATVGTQITLIIGPVVFAALMFDQTRGLFEGWLRILITLFMTKLMAIVLISTCLFVFEDTASQYQLAVGTDKNFQAAVGYLIVALVIFAMTAIVPQFAQSIGGGVAVSGTKIAQTAGVAALGAATGVVMRSAGIGKAVTRMGHDANAARQFAANSGKSPEETKKLVAAARRGALMPKRSDRLNSDALRAQRTVQRIDQQMAANKSRKSAKEMAS